MQRKKLLTISRKRYKRIVFVLKNIVIILAAISLFIGIIFLYKSSFFRISIIDCKKNNFPCKKELSFFEELRGNIIFLAKTTKLAKQLEEQLLTIREIKIKKQLPNKVFIEIIPRTKFVSITNDEENWYIVDSDYFIYQLVFEKPNDIPLIKLKDKSHKLYLGQQVNNNQILRAIELIRAIENSYLSYREIIVAESRTINLQLDDSLIASFSAAKNIQTQVDSLQFILRQSKIEGKTPAFIDLRFDKPVIK